MKTRRKGQSTIEFTFVLFAFIFFLSLSYNAVVSFAVYQYLSYANFMAARSFQASRGTKLLQEQKSLATMQLYVPGVTNNMKTPVPFAFSSKRKLAIITAWDVPYADSPNLPFHLEFQVPLLSLPLGDEIRKEFGWLNLHTDVILGREVTQEECLFFFTRFFDSLGGHSPHTAAGMEDNGC